MLGDNVSKDLISAPVHTWLERINNRLVAG